MHKAGFEFIAEPKESDFPNSTLVREREGKKGREIHLFDS